MLRTSLRGCDFLNCDPEDASPARSAGLRRRICAFRAYPGERETCARFTAQIHGSFVGGLRSAQTAHPQDDNKKWLLCEKKSQPLSMTCEPNFPRIGHTGFAPPQCRWFP